MVLNTAHQITFSRHSNSRFFCSLVSVSLVIAIALSTVWVVVSLASTGVNADPSQKTIIIDTDPGIDDAVALLTTLGDPSVKVLAITCVRGNTNVPNVAINALKIIRIAKSLSIPVYMGNNFGLIDTLNSDDYFGKDGLGDLPFPNPPLPSDAEKEHAAIFLAEIVNSYEGQITIICLGPLTNIALALNINPRFLQQASKVVILGGSIRGQGNVAPGIEFNFYMDPDAAAVVLSRALNSSTPVTLVPMETVLDNDLTKTWRWNVLAKINNSVVTFMNKIETVQQQNHPSEKYYPYDAYAVSVVICPNFVTYSQQFYGFVENRSDRTKGVLVIDYNNITTKSANLEIVMEVNTTLMKQRMFSDLYNFM